MIMHNAPTNIVKIFTLITIFLFTSTSCAIVCKKKISEKDNFVVTLATSHGDIKFMLLNETPLHRDNFIKLARDGYYDNMLFHRVINNFIIQTGDSTTIKDRSIHARENYGKMGASHLIKAEILPQFNHYRGAVSAAREGYNNPNKMSSGSHFYFVQRPGELEVADSVNEETKQKDTPTTVKEKYIERGGTPHLDGDYTIFGYILQGIDVVDKICAIECNSKSAPLIDVEIMKVGIKIENRKKIDKKYNHYAK